MYPLAVVGDNATARAAIAACRKAGFHDISWHLSNEPTGTSWTTAAATLSANITRVLSALDGAATLEDIGHIPDRQQVRLARSGFLVSELPLGNFSRNRYNAPHVNIDADAWPQLLPSDTPGPAECLPLADLERTHSAVLMCDANAYGETLAPTHTLWHAVLPQDAATARANITWLGQQQNAWQFSSKANQHIVFSAPLDRPLQQADWHPMLHSALEAAEQTTAFHAFEAQVREHWHAGSVVYLGPACSPGNPYLRETQALGVEDAWVLSRMLENYEEDIQDGFSEYEKYRRARTRRVAQAAAKLATQMNHAGSSARFLQHVNVALSSRFLPEIAMQRIDWLYGYDCIRGFR